MRGVSLRGRRLPANRSVGPARPPVVSGSRTSALAGRSRGQLCRRPQDRARRAVPTPSAARTSITTRNSTAHGSVARGPRFARGSPARWHPVCDRDYDSCPGIGRQPMTCTDQPMPPAFRRECRRSPRPLAGQPALLLPAPAYLAAAGPAATRACRAHHLPARCLDRSSRTSPHGGSARVHSRHRVKPCPPPCQPPLPRGRGHCLAEPDPRLAWLASTVPEPATGRICVLTGNRAQPVAGRVVCSNRLLRSNTSLP